MSLRKKKGPKKDIPGEELEPTAGEATGEEPKEEEIPGSELDAVPSVKPEEQADPEPVSKVQPKVSLEDVPGKYKKFQ